MLRRTERREYALMLAPYVIGMTALIAVPAAITFGLAVTEYDLIRPPVFNGLDNFRELWNDDIFRIAMRNSLMFILFAVPLRLLGALAFSLLLWKRFRGVAALPDLGVSAHRRSGRRLRAALALDLQPALRPAEPGARVDRRADAVAG